jgi:DNA-directed RNA polymerase subunit N (RpoN/RPB10)
MPRPAKRAKRGETPVKCVRCGANRWGIYKGWALVFDRKTMRGESAQHTQIRCTECGGSLADQMEPEP